MDNLEHPAISRALRTGYGYLGIPPLTCSDCGEDIGDYAFNPDSDTFICQDCFIERVEDYLSTNPRDVAEALSVEWFYTG